MALLTRGLKQEPVSARLGSASALPGLRPCSPTALSPPHRMKTVRLLALLRHQGVLFCPRALLPQGLCPWCARCLKFCPPHVPLVPPSGLLVKASSPVRSFLTSRACPASVPSPLPRSLPLAFLTFYLSKASLLPLSPAVRAETLSYWLWPSVWIRSWLSPRRAGSK